MPGQALLAQRGHLFPWTAVSFGAGIGAYFALRFEPGALALGLVALAVLAALALVRPLGAGFGPLAVALALAGAGFCTAALRAHLVAAPVLSGPYYGPVQGRIVEIDRSASDALRLTLDRVVLADLPPGARPARVRLSLQGDLPFDDPVPGTVVILTGYLDGPMGPVEPGDFDFRLHAWFAGLGAVGYTRTPVLVLHPPEPGPGLWLARTRMALSRAMQALVPGDAGGLAAAVMTGDRSGLSVAASDAMRDSNLYHIVSISGMHMGMLTGIVLSVLRAGIALVPPLALRVPAKKVAALAALPVAAFYLALAGRDVATERAFVMVAVMLGAILLDRQALTLRSVAIAALIVLALRPESLLNPGFQMSFAAVIALVSAFQGLRRLSPVQGRWRWLVPVALLVFSSLVAGTATAPLAAAHFNRVAHFGLIANLLAVPVMGMVVMPAALLLAVLGPFGITEPARSLVAWGCEWILAVSSRVAGWDGAISPVVAPPGAVVPLLALGALTMVLWRGWGRFAGVLPMALALALWVGAERPALLIADSGGLAGLLVPGGRSLSRDTGEAFVAANWRENDGTAGPVPEGAPGGFVLDGRIARGAIGGLPLVAVRGEVALAALSGCGGAAILVSSVAVPDRSLPCLILDPPVLEMTGALAGEVRDGILTLTPAAMIAGRRLWTGERGGEGGVGLPAGGVDGMAVTAEGNAIGAIRLPTGGVAVDALAEEGGDVVGTRLPTGG